MPSIFSRFSEIISSNLNSILDKAENPIKMLKLMIGEMEDTLVEIKAACAQSMAERVHHQKRLRQITETRDLWLKRAHQAANKNQDDLARAALLEKRRAEEALTQLTEEDKELEAIISRYQTEIEQLDTKIRQAREKEHLMDIRQDRAEKSLKASGQMKRYDLAAAQVRLTRLDQKLDRLEAEADLEQSLRNLSGLDPELEHEFDKLDDSLEQELRTIKSGLTTAG